MSLDQPLDGSSDDAASDEHLRAIEAILLVAHEPVSPDLIAQLIERPLDEVINSIERLGAEYREQGRGFEIGEVAGGYRFQTVAEVAPWVERFVLSEQRARLSGAALETLAIVAYKQPISRAQVASIRGVDPDGVLRSLAARGYIAEVGRDPGPGQAVMWGTTQTFLERLGLPSLDDLPPIAEFIPSADVVETLESGLRLDTDIITEPVADADG